MSLSKNTLKVISDKLDISEIKEGTFLYGILSVVDDYASAKISEVEQKLKNIHIETCDNESLIRYGNDFGVEKMNIPVISILSSDSLVYIETPTGETFPSFLNGKVILSKGQTIHYKKTTITILKDAIVDSLLSKIYIDCSITSSENFIYSSDIVNPVTVGDQYLKYVNLKIETDIVFSYIEESYLSYRMRLLNEIKLSKNNTVANIERYIRSIPGIKFAEISKNKLFFCTDEMFEDGISIKTGQYKNIIQSELARILPWPIDYSVVEKDKASINITVSISGIQKNTSQEIISTIYNYLYRSISVNQKNIPIKGLETYVLSKLDETVSISYTITDTVTDSELEYLPSVFNDCYLFLDISNVKVV